MKNEQAQNKSVGAKPAKIVPKCGTDPAERAAAKKGRHQYREARDEAAYQSGLQRAEGRRLGGRAAGGWATGRSRPSGWSSTGYAAGVAPESSLHPANSWVS